MGEICPNHDLTIEHVQTLLDKGAQNVDEIVGPGCPICTNKVRKMIEDYNKKNIFDRTSGEITRMFR